MANPTDPKDTRERSHRFVPVAALAVTIPLLLFAGVVTVGWAAGDSGDAASNGPAVTSSTLPVDDSIDVAALTLSVGCTVCHTTDGSPNVGPTWQGLAGSERTFEDGTTAIADEAYILESIVDPAAKIVAGFPPAMPPGYGNRLTDAELGALVRFIQSLG